MSESEKKSGAIKRRDVLKLGTAAAAGFVAKGVMGETSTKMPALPHNPVTQDAMPMRNLGKTGFQVGLFSLGGQAAIEQPNNFDEAVPLIEKALDLVVNYADTSARYGGAEDRWSNARCDRRLQEGCNRYCAGHKVWIGEVFEVSAAMDIAGFRGRGLQQAGKCCALTDRESVG